MHRTCLTLSTALLAVSALAVVQKPRDPSQKHDYFATVRAEHTLDQTIELLRIETRIGDIALVRAKADKLEITADVRVDRERAAEITDPNSFGQHVRVLRKDKVLTIVDAHKDAEDREAWLIPLTIAVPRALSIDAVTGAGKVIVKLGSGDIQLKTGAGDVALEIEAAASVSATTRAGNMELVLDQVTGPVEAMSGAGNVALRLTESAAEHTVRLNSASGNVSLELPAKASGRFDLSADVGSISTEGCEGIKIEKHIGGVSASGALGEGGPLYDLKARVGSIRVSRKP